MPPAKPSLELLRSLSDEHVLRALVREPQLTRAELAERTGLSKPTVSDSVRRLVEAGLVRDTGARTTGRGRVGSYYALTDGRALALSIAPAGVVAETLDVRGAVVARREAALPHPASAAQVRRAIRAVAVDSPYRVAVVSAADPVDRATGRLVQLPDAPFLVGALDPVRLLTPLVTGPVQVDNDVHWAARAERARGGWDDFAYLYLGDGLGAAIVGDGAVRRGAHGIAGEIAHVLVRDARGRAAPFTEVFAQLGLRRPGSTAVDTPRLIAARSARVRATIAAAVADVITAVVALADPALVVLGGPWAAAVHDEVAAEFAGRPRAVPLRAAAVADAPLAGARQAAADALQAAVVGSAVVGMAP